MGRQYEVILAPYAHWKQLEMHLYYNQSKRKHYEKPIIHFFDNLFSKRYTKIFFSETMKRKKKEKKNELINKQKDECRVGAVVPDRSTEAFLPRVSFALGSMEMNLYPPYYGLSHHPRPCTITFRYLHC